MSKKEFMKISICMIVKNEEAVLARAIGNWRLLADELIIVDTGSTDETVNIATLHGAQVLHYDWVAPGNKGEARNVGLDAATGDWIVVLDADEIIQAPENLRHALLEQDIQAEGLDVHFNNYDAQGAITMTWLQLRVFRRGTYRYKHREHEMPFPIIDGARIGIIDIVFEHRPPEIREQTKIGPMLNRLLLDCEEHPGDPHPLYFTHRQFVLAGDYEKAIEYGQRFLSTPGDHDRCECFGNMAHAYLQCGHTETAVQYLHQAVALQPTRRIWWIRLAEIYSANHQWNTAMAFLRGASELIPAPEQHYQPQANTTYLYDLMQRCQIAQATGAHTHG